MNTKYNDPEVEAGFKLWYGNNNKYPVSNAYNEPEFYRSVKRDFDSFKNTLDTNSTNTDLSEYKLADKNFVPPQPRKPGVAIKQSSKNNAFSPDDPWYELKKFIRKGEGMIPYPYLDKYGKVTECDGNYDENFEEFDGHPYTDKITKLPATTEQKWQEWNKLKKELKNYKAKYYQDKTNLELDPEYCNYLLDHNIKIRDAELKRGFPNYSKMSQSMKNALIEHHFTHNVLRNKDAKAGAREMDKNKFCEKLKRNETKRPDMIERNKWVKEQCMKGHFNK